ncbi:AAA family ATPase [Oscillibacter valericigenes]|uniref:AAA family ATPase n=1 Tax=Oscillibacter valericigenes TaxID=351091 RepID=UPI001F3B61FC|nr:AAA family ATPase [Oscillibacter valericigenes]MCF2663192.1 AAA family ATPase [Oscillibacter valericigenes]
MRFNWITIENFGPFKDKERIVLSSDNGVTIVWGDNGRGKTSISNALNFVLFGEVRDRKGNTNDFISAINVNGAADGRYSFQVSLDVSDDEQHYIIRRSISPRPGVTVPQSNDDLIAQLQVNSNGFIVDSTEANHIVNNIIPKEVSRFFLFDGELLQEYEDLLNEKSTNGITIKNSIEQILGLPILTFGRKDISSSVATYSADAVKIAQNDSNTAKYANHLAQAQARKAEQEKEKDRLEGELAKLQNEKRALEEELKQSAHYRELVTKRDALIARIETMEAQLKDKIADSVLILKDAWRWMIKTPIEQRRTGLQSNISKLSAKKSSASVQQALLDYLQTAIDETSCPICEHDCTPEELVQLRAKMDALRSNASGLTPEEASQLESESNELASLASVRVELSRANELKKLLREIDDLRVKISDLKDTQLHSVKADIATYLATYKDDPDAPFEAAKRLASCEQEMKVISQGIENTQKAIDDLIAKIADFNKKIATLSQNKDVQEANRVVQLVTDLECIFAEAIDEYRNRLRKEVEADATELFLAMSDEEDYDHLEINDNYGLSIITKDGTPAPNRSAGWEHMVAFALIGALHRNAPLEGPVFMDSPFIRISRIKKANMVKALPKLSDQVVLLAFPGEIDEGTTRNDLGANLVQEYSIERVNSRHSRIVKGGV